MSKDLRSGKRAMSKEILEELKKGESYFGDYFFFI
jgi:hypothetical protein